MSGFAVPVQVTRCWSGGPHRWGRGPAEGWGWGGGAGQHHPGAGGGGARERGQGRIQISSGADVAVHRAVPEPLPQTRLQGGTHHHHRGLQTPGAQGDVPSVPVGGESFGGIALPLLLACLVG